MAEQYPLLTVYVPVPGSFADRHIKRGSAIVGDPSSVIGDELILDYEGSIYQQFGSYEDLLLQAAARHVTRYPTVARIWVPPDQCIAVGTYDYATRTLVVERDDLLSAYREGWHP